MSIRRTLWWIKLVKLLKIICILIFKYLPLFKIKTVKEFKVYVLVDPISLKIRYIGITKSSLEKRLYNHISEAKTLREGLTYKNNWIRSLFKMNTQPIIRLLTSFNTREECAKMEELLIVKYKDSHKLTNQIVDEGKFTSKGVKSALNLKSKQVYVYSYEGIFLKEFNSIKECSEELNITYSTIKKCLKGEYKYAKQYQFSYTKQDMPNLSSYSKDNWNEVELLDTQSNTIIKYPKMTKLIEELNLRVSKSSVRVILGALNKQYGNKYQLKVNGEWKFSTYYNTGVKIIFGDNSIKTYTTKKELGIELGFKGGFTQSQLEKRLKSTNNIKEILYNLCPLE